MSVKKEYWKERALARELNSQLIVERHLSGAFPLLVERQQRMIEQLELFYARYAENERIGAIIANQKLSKAELKEFADIDLKRFRELSLKADPAYENILTRASLRHRMTRLEALLLRLEMQVVEMYGSPEGLQPLTYKALSEVYEEGYYKSMYDLYVAGVAIPGNILISPSFVKGAMSYNWSGKEFSNRIWGHQAETMATIRKTVETGVLNRSHPSRVARMLIKNLDIQAKYSNAMRLARTEGNFFNELGAQNSYEDAGIEEYEILATLDSRTSTICQGMDGKRFAQSDYRPNITAPPFHVRCRTTTIPIVLEEYLELIGGVKRRAGADLIDKVTYEEWKKSKGVSE